MKWTRKRIVLSFVGLILIASIWAFLHWMSFMMFSPMPASEKYDWQMSLVAGNGEAGYADGDKDTAKFHKPIRLAPYGEKAVVMADINNHAIRLVYLDGKTVTIAGGPDKQGHMDGPGHMAKFDSPHGVAVRPDGTIAVAEASNNTIRLISPLYDDVNNPAAYRVTTIGGQAGESGYQDGTAEESLFSAPHAVAWGKNDALYVADIGNARLRKIDNGHVTTVAGNGSYGTADGDLQTGELQYPMDIRTTEQGDVYIADAGTGMIRLYKEGEGLSTPWPDIKLDMPHGIAIAPNGDLVVAEMYAYRIALLNKEQQIIRLAGTGEAGSSLKEMQKPSAVLVHDGYLWIADLNNHRILTIPWQL